ncbi:hypothetical protein GS444_20515 [Rhodococcus hoagii]|nr:hypothetical protein [Prescottella equi]
MKSRRRSRRPEATGAGHEEFLLATLICLRKSVSGGHRAARPWPLFPQQRHLGGRRCRSGVRPLLKLSPTQVDAALGLAETTRRST